MTEQSFNEAQAICAQTYLEGEHSHVSNIEECGHVGDSLFLFLMTELSKEEGAEDNDEALSRLESVRTQIDEIKFSISGIDPGESEWPALVGEGKDCLNAAQKAMLEVYGDGDFAYITGHEEAEETVDGLLPFLFSELSANQDCDSADEALRRMDIVCRDIDRVYSAIEQASLGMDAPSGP